MLSCIESKYFIERVLELFCFSLFFWHLGRSLFLRPDCSFIRVNSERALHLFNDFVVCFYFLICLFISIWSLKNFILHLFILLDRFQKLQFINITFLFCLLHVRTHNFWVGRKLLRLLIIACEV